MDTTLKINQNKRNGQLLVILQKKRFNLKKKLPKFMVIKGEIKFLE